MSYPDLHQPPPATLTRYEVELIDVYPEMGGIEVESEIIHVYAPSPEPVIRAYQGHYTDVRVRPSRVLD